MCHSHLSRTHALGCNVETPRIYTLISLSRRLNAPRTSVRRRKHAQGRNIESLTSGATDSRELRHAVLFPRGATATIITGWRGSGLVDCGGQGFRAAEADKVSRAMSCASVWRVGQASEAPFGAIDGLVAVRHDSPRAPSVVKARPTLDLAECPAISSWSSDEPRQAHHAQTSTGSCRQRAQRFPSRGSR